MNAQELIDVLSGFLRNHGLPKHTPVTVAVATHESERLPDGNSATVRDVEVMWDEHNRPYLVVVISNLILSA